jgi:hypothetical protein
MHQVAGRITINAGTDLHGSYGGNSILTAFQGQTTRSLDTILRAAMNKLASIDALMLPQALGYRPGNLLAFDEAVLERERDAATDPEGPGMQGVDGGRLLVGYL